MSLGTRKVLVVSYFYPPFTGVGALRLSKMTRYLADHGWEAHVLTVEHCDLPATMPLEIPEDRIVRTPHRYDAERMVRALVGGLASTDARVAPSTGLKASILWRLGEAYRHVVCFPDRQIGWAPAALAAGLQLIARIKPDLILSSSLPNTSHIVARSLARRAGLPWVAELRDLWTDNHNFRRVWPLGALERRLENRVLSQASAMVTVSEILVERLARRYDVPVHLVSNGFDPTDYPQHRSGPAKVFTIVYTGMFYNGRQTADPLFAAIARLAATGRIKPDMFRVRLVGQFLGPLLERARALGAESFVSAEPPITYRASLELQCQATALLMLDWEADPQSGYYSVKIFEYLGADRPILSIGSSDSPVGRLVIQSRAGQVADTPGKVEAVLRGWLDEFDRTGALVATADESIKRGFHRQEKARQLAAILDQVQSGRGAS